MTLAKDNRLHEMCPYGTNKHNCALEKSWETEAMGDIYLVPDFSVTPVSPDVICNWCRKQHAQNKR